MGRCIGDGFGRVGGHSLHTREDVAFDAICTQRWKGEGSEAPEKRSSQQELWVKDGGETESSPVETGGE